MYNHSTTMKKMWENDEFKNNHSTTMKKMWENDEFREKQSNIRKKIWSDEHRKKEASLRAKKRWKDDDFREKIKKSKEAFNNKIRYSYDFIKEQIEKIGYKLISTEYINANTKLRIQCDKGHEIEIRYGDIQQGIRCVSCFSISSKSEKEVSEYIKSLNLEIEEQNRILISPLELDIVIPSKKIAIEYCGLYWHSVGKGKNYHKDKLEKCNQAGYRLITIFEDEWLNKKEIVKNRLKYILGLETERIYARKCIVREIEKNQAKDFIDKHHIQGYGHSTICLGAFYNNEIVAVNTFKKKKTKDFELNRFCTNKNIVGVASKLLEYFKLNYNYNKIITFADRRWSEGNLYEKIGFKKDKILEPDYSYADLKNIRRYHKFGFRHNQMKNKLEKYDSSLSESVNMKSNGWLRIWDCGKIRYVL